MSKKKKDHHCFKFGFALPCFLFALVNWGSSSAWIGAYFLGHIEKTMIHHKLLHSLKNLGLFNVLKNVSSNVHSNFLLFRSEESQHHL